MQVFRSKNMTFGKTDSIVGKRNGWISWWGTFTCGSNNLPSSLRWDPFAAISAWNNCNSCSIRRMSQFTNLAMVTSASLGSASPWCGASRTVYPSCHKMSRSCPAHWTAVGRSMGTCVQRNDDAFNSLGTELHVTIIGHLDSLLKSHKADQNPQSVSGSRWSTSSTRMTVTAEPRSSSDLSFDIPWHWFCNMSNVEWLFVASSMIRFMEAALRFIPVCSSTTFRHPNSLATRCTRLDLPTPIGPEMTHKLLQRSAASRALFELVYSSSSSHISFLFPVRRLVVVVVLLLRLIFDVGWPNQFWRCWLRFSTLARSTFWRSNMNRSIKWRIWSYATPPGTIEVPVSVSVILVESKWLVL